MTGPSTPPKEIKNGINIREMKAEIAKLPLDNPGDELRPSTANNVKNNSLGSQNELRPKSAGGNPKSKWSSPDQSKLNRQKPKSPEELKQYPVAGEQKPPTSEKFNLAESSRSSVDNPERKLQPKAELKPPVSEESKLVQQPPKQEPNPASEKPKPEGPKQPVSKEPHLSGGGNKGLSNSAESLKGEGESKPGLGGVAMSCIQAGFMVMQAVSRGLSMKEQEEARKSTQDEIRDLANSTTTVPFHSLESSKSYYSIFAKLKSFFYDQNNPNFVNHAQAALPQSKSSSGVDIKGARTFAASCDADPNLPSCANLMDHMSNEERAVYQSLGGFTAALDRAPGGVENLVENAINYHVGDSILHSLPNISNQYAIAAVNFGSMSPKEIAKIAPVLNKAGIRLELSTKSPVISTLPEQKDNFASRSLNSKFNLTNESPLVEKNSTNHHLTLERTISSEDSLDIFYKHTDLNLFQIVSNRISKCSILFSLEK